MFFSTASRPTVRNTGRGRPRSLPERGWNRWVSTPRGQRISLWKPRPLSSLVSELVDAMVTRPALWNQRSQLQLRLLGIGQRAAA